MLKNLAFLVVVGLIGLICTRILHLDFKKLSSTVVSNSFGYIGNVNMQLHKKHQREKKTSTKKSFADSKLYLLCETIIKDLAFTGVTVEGFITTVLIFSFLISLVFYLLLHSIFLFILCIPAISIFITILLYMLSSDAYYKRKYARMAAEDYITAELKSGVYAAIVNTYQMMGPEVQPAYKGFLDRVQSKMSVEESLVYLMKDLGLESKPFIEKLIGYEKLGRSGMLDVFWDHVKENSKTRDSMMIMQRFLKQVNFAYTSALAIVGVLVLIMLGSMPAAVDGILHSVPGNIAILIAFCVILYGFARLQSFRD